MSNVKRRVRLIASLVVVGVLAVLQHAVAIPTSAVPAIAAADRSTADAAPDTGWPDYGGDAGGRRYSAAAQITSANVDGLREQWRYRTGDMARRDPALIKRVKFETTPILVDDELVLCSSFNEVIALDPATGRERWRHDPQIATDLRPANRYNCRGVAQWRDPTSAANAVCAVRILTGTVDARSMRATVGHVPTLATVARCASMPAKFCTGRANFRSALRRWSQVMSS